MATSDGLHLILGASGGIGAALARTLRERGLRPALAGRDASRLQDLAGELDAPVLEVDGTDSAALDAAVADPAPSTAHSPDSPTASVRCS